MATVFKLAQKETVLARLSEAERQKLNGGSAVCELFADGCLLAFHFCDPAGAAQMATDVMLICRPGELCVLTDNAHCARLAEALDKTADAVTQLSLFLEALTENDLPALVELENEITDMEDEMLVQSGVDKQAMRRIIHVRRRLLMLKRYYQQLAFILGELTEDTPGLFGMTSASRKRFSLVERRLDRLLESVSRLREYTTQVREAYQAQVDIEQNQIMKIFTVITAIFLPLTLIVGWYGMNLKMPEFQWEYGYLYMILQSAVILGVCVWIFKRKKWF